MASDEKTSAGKQTAAAPSPGGSEQKVAAVEKKVGSTTSSAKTAREKQSSSGGGQTKADRIERNAESTALQPSPGGSNMKAEQVRAELPPKADPRPKAADEPSKRGSQVTLRGRFSPGTPVELVKVAGPQVLRSTPADEVVASGKVDKDGHVQFKSGVESGQRYLVRGYQQGFLLEIRAIGRSEAQDSEVLALAPVGNDEVRTRDGRVFGERGQRIPDTPEHLAR